MARSSKVQGSVHAIAHVAGLTLLLVAMQPILASGQDGGQDNGTSNVDADSDTQNTKQIPKPPPKITYLPSSKSDPTCGSGKRATVVKYSGRDKVGETEKKCIPKSPIAVDTE